MGSEFLRWVWDNVADCKFHYELTYADGEGDSVILPSHSDMSALANSIQSFIEEGAESSFVRSDGKTIRVHASQQKPGKLVVERKDGAWGRFTKEEARELIEELSAASSLWKQIEFDTLLRETVPFSPVRSDPFSPSSNTRNDPLFEPRPLFTPSRSLFEPEPRFLRTDLGTILDDGRGSTFLVDPVSGQKKRQLANHYFPTYY
jgi:hypothetical protein